MRRFGRESWKMNIDFPIPLQFAAYIGQHQGFAPTADAGAASRVEAEWRQWWDSLPAVFAEAQEESLRLLKAGERYPPELIANIFLDPPEFERMANWPELQLLCRSYWDTFHPEWNREKMRLARRQVEQHRELGVQKIVKECARQAGHKPRPFRLRLDCTCWPTDYRRVVSGNHLVLGIGYLDDARIDNLRALLRWHIAGLV